MDFNFMDFLKLPTKIMVALGLASGMILFLPDSIIVRMYMGEFREKYGFIIGSIFIISLCILIITSAIAIYNVFKEKYISKKVKKNSEKFLVSLDIFKKAIVYGMYIEEDHTEVLPLNSGAVVYLESMLVIGKVANQYFVDDITNLTFPYMLQPWVIEKLQNDNELLLSYKEAYNIQIEKSQNNESYSINNCY